MGMSGWIDLSQLVVNGMPEYPGDSKTVLEQWGSLDTDGYNGYRLDMSMHTGTHIDGPMHLTDSSTYLSQFPLETFIGEGCVLDVSGQAVIEYKEKYEKLIGEKQIVILHTGHSRLYGQAEYFSNYPVVTEGLAELFIRKQVPLVGLDTPSPDRYPFAVHKLLFRNRVLIAENLVRTERLLGAGRLEIIALPLSIHADSAAARVIARRLDD